MLFGEGKRFAHIAALTGGGPRKPHMARHGMAWHGMAWHGMASQAGANALHAGASGGSSAARCAAALRRHWVREVVVGTALCHAMPSASGRALRTAHAAQAHRGRVTYV